MDSELNHMIMLRSKLQDQYLKNEPKQDGIYTAKRRSCDSLAVSEKKYFEKLDLKLVSDNKIIWK